MIDLSSLFIRVQIKYFALFKSSIFESVSLWNQQPLYHGKNAAIETCLHHDIVLEAQNFS